MKATCEQCDKEAMCVHPEDATRTQEVLFYAEHGEPVSRVVLRCAYCGNEQRTSDFNEIWHAYHFGDTQRSFWAKVLAKEREKVARLMEGRW